MQLYNCVVRLAGTVTSEVPKADVTAAEILLLRQMHGQDSVVKISRSRQDKRAHAEERRRLSGVYGDELVKELFGPNFNRLPVRLEGFTDDDPVPSPPAAAGSDDEDEDEDEE